MMPFMRQDRSELTGARPADPEQPLADFSRCHDGILERLHAYSDLPAQVAIANRARQVAADVLTLFERGVLAHHGDEEGELFPAVVRWAHPGEELERVKQLIKRLTLEHREIEALWRAQRPAVEAVARGKPSDLEKAATMQLVQAYEAHARLEEREFLPLAQEILGRDSGHMAALGMSLHLRHAPHFPGYV